MTTMNGAVLDPRDVTIPSQEPVIAALTGVQPQESPANGQIDDKRREELAASVPQLAPYLAEKYGWKFSANGNEYLSPHERYLTYIAGKKAVWEGGKLVSPATDGAASRVCDFAIGLIYPDGEHGKTDEAAQVEQLVDAATAYLQSARAASDNEGKAFERHLIDRVTRNATYAASTQFELENWAERAAAQGKDASEHQNFGEKESRMLGFAMQAGIAFAVVKRVLPEAKIDAATFNKVAVGIAYESAEFEGKKLRKPKQLSEQQQAGAAAAKATVRRF